MEDVIITLRDVAVLSGLPVEGDVVINDVMHEPDMSWISYTGSVFGYTPTFVNFNGSRLRLGFDSSITPYRLAENASVEDIRHQTLCYLVQLIGGVLFTNYSGGLVHPMFLHFLHDLDRCGEYASGAAAS